MYSVLGDQFSKSDMVLLWKGRKEDLEWATELIAIPKHYYILDIDSRDDKLLFDFKAVKKIKKMGQSIAKRSNEIGLYTSHASGMYFEVLKASLCVENQKVTQFDDGLINEFIVTNKYRLIRFVAYLFHGFVCYPPK